MKLEHATIRLKLMASLSLFEYGRENWTTPSYILIDVWVNFVELSLKPEEIYYCNDLGGFEHAHATTLHSNVRSNAPLVIWSLKIGPHSDNTLIYAWVNFRGMATKNQGDIDDQWQGIIFYNCILFHILATKQQKQ